MCLCYTSFVYIDWYLLLHGESGGLFLFLDTLKIPWADVFFWICLG